MKLKQSLVETGPKDAAAAKRMHAVRGCLFYRVTSTLTRIHYTIRPLAAVESHENIIRSDLIPVVAACART